MKSKTKRDEVKTLGALRANLLAAVAELDLKGTDSKVTQAMCIIEQAFNAMASGQRLNAKRIFRLGIAKAKLVA
jgi:hypothetical protein